MRFHPFHPRAAAFAALVLYGASALAQTPPPPPSGAPAPVVTGRIQQWLINPNGDVDGLLLADGTQVAFPPHLSATVQQTMKPGDTVQVAGWRAPNVSVVRAATLTATTSGRSVSDQPPGFGAMPPRPREPGALTAMSASGRVARQLYTDRGDANGVVLDNGTIVRFPPHVGAQLAPTLQAGSTLHAKGWGSRGAQGSALEATAIGTTADGMRELFAGPGSEPPPPRAPRGPRAERPLPPPPAS